MKAVPAEAVRLWTARNEFESNARPGCAGPRNSAKFLQSMSNSKLADFDEPEIHSEVDTMRHSAAHVMAHAIQKLWPQAKFGIGPTVENGFFYDIDLDVKLTPEDLPKIEAEMNKLIKANQKFLRQEHSIDEALQMFKKLGQPFKVEIIETLRDGMNATSVSTYSEGDFIDLC